MRVAASLLGADPLHLGAALARLEAAGVDGLHLDIMDGTFVDEIAFGAAWARAVAGATRLPVAAHLMVARPEGQVLRLAASGCRQLIFHLESTSAPTRLLADICGQGQEAAVALSPGTGVDGVRWLGEGLAQVVVMTVEPGAGGQPLRPGLVAKVRALAAVREEASLAFRIAVDGGVCAAVAGELVAAGADDLVVGGALIGAADPARAVAEIRAAAARPRR